VHNQLDENNLFTFQEQQLDSAAKASQYQQIINDKVNEDAGAEAYEYAEDETINRQEVEQRQAYNYLKE